MIPELLDLSIKPSGFVGQVVPRLVFQIPEYCLEKLPTTNNPKEYNGKWGFSLSVGSWCTSAVYILTAGVCPRLIFPVVLCNRLGQLIRVTWPTVLIRKRKAENKYKIRNQYYNG